MNLIPFLPRAIESKKKKTSLKHILPLKKKSAQIITKMKI